MPITITVGDSTPAVEKTMTDFCIANEVDPKYFFAHSHGVRTRDNVKRFQKGGADLSEEDLIAQVNVLETAIAANGKLLGGITKLPGVERLLSTLREKNARWGIVTSATRAYADSALNTSGILPGSLPFLITAGDCFSGKPNPEPYLRGIIELTKLPGPLLLAHDILVIEDAPSGLASGLAAGNRTLAVCTGQPREIIRNIEATYKVVDLDRVKIISVIEGIITLEITTLEEEEAAEALAAESKTEEV